MEAKALNPRDLFEGRVSYEIPPFQRPYVWTEEDQWQPLWDDVARVAEEVLQSDGDSDGETEAHFLGAVVLKYMETPTGDPTRRQVIDGQQRLTTLQLLLDAAHAAIDDIGDEDDAESLQELVVNGAKKFRNTPKRFKLWPSRIDRVAFEAAMDDDASIPASSADSRIVRAHAFFDQAIRAWAEVTGDPLKAAARLTALAQVLQQRLQIVAIDLSGSDDDQLIFETLNDRGTPLLAADLIKNYVFQRCDDVGGDVDTWSDVYWQEFDDDWWRDQVAQGRLYRSRIDLFLQYWLTMRLRAEVPTDAVFARFRAYSSEHLTNKDDAETFLKGLRSDAETFREFTELDPKTVRGGFYSRVVEALELGAFIPLLLWMISDNHDAPPAQADCALAAVESWAVRRTLLRRTMKDVNRFVVAILVELDNHEGEDIGELVAGYLDEQTADARVWPTDEQVKGELPEVRMYGNIKQTRLRALFSAVELQLRTERSEAVSLPDKLEIEHVMPQGWRSHWADGIAQNPELSVRRDHLVNTLGNLTLVTKKLNVALSNRPWRDDEAEKVAPTGKDAGKGKRSLLDRFSVLVLNKDVLTDHEEAWTEDDIADRSAKLTSTILTVWPHG